MIVYVVTEVINAESGETEIERVYATRREAEAYVKRHYHTWKPWWADEEENALAIEEWEVETED